MHKKKIKVLSVVVAVIVAAMALNLCGRVFRLYERKMALQAAQAESEKISAECDDLSEELNLLDDDDYVTRYARGHWVFTKEGETVIPLPKDSVSNPED